MTVATVPLILDVQGRSIPLPPGARLMAAILPMLTPSAMNGPVAQVAANPNDPSQMGLQNLTAQPWPARMVDGTERQVLPGQTLRLAEGVLLQWGAIIVQVRSALAPPAGQQAPPPAAPQQSRWQAGSGPVRPQQVPLSASGSSLSLSRLMPLFSQTSRPRLLALLVPGVILVVLTTLLFANQLADGQIRVPQYIDTLGILLLLITFAIVYQICGKKKPWVIFLISAVMTGSLFVLAATPFGPGGRFAYFFATPSNLFGDSIVGLREELLKAVPIFLCLFIGMKAKSPWDERIGVREPLDGILIGAASATGFTFSETLWQYIPHTMNQVFQMVSPHIGQTAGQLAGFVAGLELVIPRILGDISGHIAYSGVFGYFIGLSALIPKHRVKLLLTGWITASVLHAFWDTGGDLPASHDIHTAINLVVGVLSFALLAAVVVKARQLSPGRAMNFATQINRRP